MKATGSSERSAQDCSEFASRKAPAGTGDRCSSHDGFPLLLVVLLAVVCGGLQHGCAAAVVTVMLLVVLVMVVGCSRVALSMRTGSGSTFVVLSR
ncbi:hypothetical protein [Streptomyces sp. NPDC093149]|uniref:hypothetical protein n=1 Tax=Streptomyces sp. NPDC093149 TaxID=3366031 RepID=UPI0038037801